eukprot:4341899-Amphidinium_carterae.1
MTATTVHTTVATSCMIWSADSSSHRQAMVSTLHSSPRVALLKSRSSHVRPYPWRGNHKTSPMKTPTNRTFELFNAFQLHREDFARARAAKLTQANLSQSLIRSHQRSALPCITKQAKPPR